MRRDLAREVARLQRMVWMSARIEAGKGVRTLERVGGGEIRETGGPKGSEEGSARRRVRVREVWMHGENFAL
jgi:hypothetical protein